MSPLNSPHWLGHERLLEKRLIDHELVWPDGRPHALVKRSGRQVPFSVDPGTRASPAVWRNFRVLEGGRGKS
jgi:hypothetical protein